MEGGVEALELVEDVGEARDGDLGSHVGVVAVEEERDLGSGVEDLLDTVRAGDPGDGTGLDDGRGVVSDLGSSSDTNVDEVRGRDGHSAIW